MRAKPHSALVLFSGGQDSTTCLAWALENFTYVETLGFHYGQRHAVEMDVRPALRDAMATINPAWHPHLGVDHLLDLSGVFDALSGTALTGPMPIELRADGLPNTFVPGRNLLFLTLAAALAEKRGLACVVGGMCQTDFSGYPDCRDDTIKTQEEAIRLGFGKSIPIKTPLMFMDKAAIWGLAHRLGGPALVDLIVEQTHTCYLGDRAIRHDWGYGCGFCPACELRANGWKHWHAEAMAEQS